MNERIEKLAMQANSHHDNFFDLNYKELDVFLEKFAELIVKDCMDIIQQNRSYASQHKWPAVELANVCLYEINKTFEVIEDEKETVSR